jgi:alpha-tubulin suppressor-like RCC1 family protein
MKILLFSPLLSLILFSCAESVVCASQPPQVVVTWHPTRVLIEATNIVSVSAGSGHQISLRADGVVFGGGLAFGVFSNVAAIDAGYFHNLAVLSNGTVVAWGGNDNGSTVVPAGLSNVMAVAAGGGHSVALRSNGTVQAWGLNGSGQTVVPPNLTNVIGISAGLDHTLAIKSDGTVAAWGHSVPDFGQSTVPPDLTNVAAVSAGSSFSVALRRDGTVAAWGYGGSGCTQVPAGLSNVTAIAAGCSHVLALKNDGSVVAWGQSTVPLGFTNVTAIGAGCESVAVCDTPPIFSSQPTNTIIYQGRFAALSVRVQGTRPFSIQWFKDEEPVPDGTNSLLIFSEARGIDEGIYSVVASNSFGIGRSSNALVTIIDGPLNFIQSPASTNAFLHQDITFSAIVDGSGPVSYQWRRDGADIFGETNSQMIIANASLANAGSYSIFISNQFGFVVSTNAFLKVGNVAIWGDNTFAQQSFPEQLTNASSITCGAEFTLALDSLGCLYTWGRNNAGQSGYTNIADVISTFARNDDSFVLRRSGELVPSSFTLNTTLTNYPLGLTNVIEIAVGRFFAIALRNDGTLLGWGNVPGSLAVSNVIQVKANRGAIALKRDGTVFGIGSVPQAVAPPNLTNIIGIECGTFHSLALRSDGTVVAWGDNSSGQTNVPATLTNAIAIAAGLLHSMALRRDHTVVVWGAGFATNVPLQLTNVVGISSGRGFCAALIDDKYIEYDRGDEIGSVLKTDGFFHVQLLTRRSHSYAFEAKDSLQAEWTWSRFLAGDGTRTNIVVDTSDRNQRFFRILRKRL